MPKRLPRDCTRHRTQPAPSEGCLPAAPRLSGFYGYSAQKLTGAQAKGMIMSLRPTPGLVSRSGMWFGYPSPRGQMGPMGRSVRLGEEDYASIRRLP
jgi:hypothetical protein